MASGRFLLRLPPDLHEALRRAAGESGLSLNEYCCRRLAAPAGNGPDREATAPAVGRACELVGDHLLAVVVYGSWARGEAQRESDVDLLVVVDSACPITREVYRRWDSRPVAIDGRAVDPHFVHLRDEDRSFTGLWAEAAMDGIVLFERDFVVSRYLGRVRREVTTGRLVRRTAHGQPYWAEVA